MRILLLAQFFPPDIGGEELHVFNLANTLAGRGHEVAVATQRMVGVPDLQTLASGVRVHRFSTAASASQVSIRPTAPITRRCRIHWASASCHASPGRSGHMLSTHTTGLSTALWRCVAHPRRDRASGSY
jgi:hypothetical protein